MIRPTTVADGATHGMEASPFTMAGAAGLPLQVRAVKSVTVAFSGSMGAKCDVHDVLKLEPKRLDEDSMVAPCIRMAWSLAMVLAKPEGV